MTGGEAEITEGIEEEMESMRRVEQRLAEFAARAREFPQRRPKRPASTGAAMPRSARISQAVPSFHIDGIPPSHT